MKRKSAPKDSQESSTKKVKVPKNGDKVKQKAKDTDVNKTSKDENKINPDRKVKKGIQKQTKPGISKFNKVGKSSSKTFQSNKPKNVKSTGEFEKNGNNQENPVDWADFKKKKKELKLKRKQVRAKDNFDLTVKAKSIGEELRKKNLKGGEQKRVQLINELHSLLKSNGFYKKFVLAHDTARLVQWLLKYASEIVIKQIAQVYDTIL